MIVELVVVVVQQAVVLLIVSLIIYYIVCVVAKLCEGLVLLWNKIKKHLKWILPSESHQYAYMEPAYNASTATVCSVCYRFCTTFTCADCNAARYCSDKCQIIHRRRWHEYECVEKKEGTDDDGVQRAAAESRPLMEVAHNTSTATTVCSVCYSSSTTLRCARCKAVRYCSGNCQIIHWRQGHKYECLEKNKSTDNRVKRPADEAHEPNNDRQTSMLGDINSYDWFSFSEDKFSLFMTSSSSAEEGNTNTNPKPLIENSEEATKKDHEQNEERMRYLEDELEKYKNEVEQLKSERDKWEKQTSFVSRRLSSLMREYDEHKIAEEARVIERRKQDEHIHKLERDLKEERKLVQGLKVEKDDEAETAKRKVHEISRELADAYRDVEYATARADNAENQWIKAKRELKEQRELVKLLKLKCEETRQRGTRQVQKKELELANALKAVAAAEAKLSDLEKEMNSSNDETCAICLTNEKDMAFGCGHMTCADCGINMSICPICREQITSRLKLFPG